MRINQQAESECPGSAGEHALQEWLGTSSRAGAFYANQVLDHLNPLMREFIARQELFFLATADAQGICDCSLRSGPSGFVRVVDETTLCYPEYRGNGVMASLGNIVENQHAGMLFADFLVSTMGLHVNGQARIVPSDHPAIAAPLTLEAPGDAGRREPRPEHWVMVSVEEAYVHCSKHIPLLQKLDKAIHWGSDAAAHKGGDYFRAKHSAHRRPAQEAAG